MNIVLTGSFGHVNRPLIDHLLSQGHHVTIVSRRSDKQPEAEALGVKIAVGQLEDVDFIVKAFSRADAVYLMEPPVNFFNSTLDSQTYYGLIAENFVRAIRRNGIKQVVHLSSVGADTVVGNGTLVFHYQVESILRELPKDVSCCHVRPVCFYYNLQRFIPQIKNHGVIVSNYGGNDLVPWVSPSDIAAAIAEAFASPQEGRSFRYVYSDELPCHETARILGTALGKPDLKWVVVSDDQVLRYFEVIGMTPKLALGLVEMNAAIHRGELFEDFHRNRPENIGKIKMRDYAFEFVRKYHI